MKNKSCILLLFSCVLCLPSFAQEHKPDTVNVGIYITSVHDIDFKQKEYSVNLWLWLKYRRPEFNFGKNLEIPMAKSFERSYDTVRVLPDGRIYMLMKLQCKMKGIWDIKDFPFDHQTLRFSIENSQYDSTELVFSADTLGDHYGKYFLVGWEKEKFDIRPGMKEYKTAFGDPDYDKPYSKYATYRVVVEIHRHSLELFSKIFLGMYISFLIAFSCFFIHPEKIDSRLTLSVGSLFAVIGNKYIVDSSLPETNTFTLVDWLHGLTLTYIFVAIAYSIHSFRYKDSEKIGRLDKRVGWISFGVYLAANAFFILRAYYSEAV